MEMFLLSGGLLIALLVSIFFISKLYGSMDVTFGNNAYKNLENKLEIAAKEYIEDFDISVSGLYKISLSTLKYHGYINELKDSDGNNCNGYVIIDNEDEVYNYKGYILCNDYQSNNY